MKVLKKTLVLLAAVTMGLPVVMGSRNDWAQHNNQATVAHI
jgi:hypothetical protein